MGTSLIWTQVWLDVLGLSDLPGWVSASLAVVLTMLFVVIPAGALLYYLDKKISADFQARVGPDQAGPRGMAQPVVDFLKLLQKQSIEGWRLGDNVWLAVHSMALYSTLAVLPLGSMALLVDAEMSAFLPFWSALVLALGTMLLGLNQNTVPGWFGGIRVAAQTLAGAFPALIALLCVGVRSGSFKWSLLASIQSFTPWTWTVVSNPFMFIAFLVFVMSGLMLIASSPLDGGLSMSDIHGGVASHLYGRRLGFYRFGRFYVFLLWSVITVVLFLGGWILPRGLVGFLKQRDWIRTLATAELCWLMLKTFTLMLLIVWIARASPRSRVNQITDFSWNVLSPFALFALVGVSVWIGWGVL